MVEVMEAVALEVKSNITSISLPHTLTSIVISTFANNLRLRGTITVSK
ncbi:MAG: hypothetical protein FWE36_07840 [Erysipelotrichales bacterium]|nr:hypothetical protein [Erysipelotrichales bacterium]